MFFGDRRVRSRGAGVIVHAAVELLLAGIDPCQHGGTRERLERRAFRKALVLAIADGGTIARIEHRDAESPVDFFLDAGQLGLNEQAAAARPT